MRGGDGWESAENNDTRPCQCVCTAVGLNKPLRVTNVMFYRSDKMKTKLNVSSPWSLKQECDPTNYRL